MQAASQPDKDVVQRVAALEADVVQLKAQSVSQTVVEQVLGYLARLDSNLSGVREDTRQMKGDLARLSTRADRLEENVSATREDI